MDSIDYFLKVKKQDIYLLCPFFEAFEGMASVRTPKPPKDEYGVLRIMVSPYFEKDFKKILKGLKKRVYIERMADETA